MPNLQKTRDAAIMKASINPRMALHSPVLMRTKVLHDKFLFISAVDVSVGVNWLWMLKEKAKPFNPVEVAVDSTGWYIVFEDSTQLWQT